MAQSTGRIVQHSLYQRYAPLWRFYLDAYQGTGQFADGSALVKFGREGPETHMNRRALAYYPNYCAPIVDIYISSILKRGVQRDLKATRPLTFPEFIENVDQCGLHLDDFIAEVATLAQVFGFCPVLVEMPAEPQQPIRSKLEQLQAGLIPYFVIILPFNVIDWRTNAFGQLEHILIKEYQQDDIERYRFIDRVRWEIIEKRGDEERVIESKEHGLGVVPVVSFKNQVLQEDSFMGLSAIRDIAKVNKRLMNLYSELDQILRNQTFSILTLPQDREEQVILGTEGGAETSGQLVGTDNALRYNPEAAHAPTFISPDASQGQLYLAAIDRLVDEIFRLARLEQFSSASREMSGVALAYKFRNTNSNLAAKADQLERGERQLWRLWCAWQGTEFIGSIHYPDEFDVRDVREFVDQALALQALDMGSPMFDKKLRKQIANSVLDNLTDREMQEIFDEIDSASFGKPVETEEAEAEIEELDLAGVGESGQNGRL